jgi:hypothetical protein
MFALISPKGQLAVRVFYGILSFTLFSLSASQAFAGSNILIEAYPPPGAVGTTYQTTLSARGGTAPYVFAASGLPQGLTLDEPTGVISGTPSTAGLSSVNATVTDANGNDAYLTFSMVISKSGTVSLVVSPETANMLSGQRQQFAAKVYNTSNQSVSWSCTAGTITSSGLYTAPKVTSGTWTYRVTATSVDDPAKTAGTIVEVAPYIPPLQITNPSLPGFKTGTQYSESVNVTGGTAPYHWKVISGALPNGIALNTTNGAVAGVSSEDGPFPFTVQVKDSTYPTQLLVTQSYTLIGSSALLVTTTQLPQITDGENYDTAVAIIGGTAPYTWSITSGTLASGISLSAGTGTISGTTEQTGQFNVTVQVTDSSSPQQKAGQQYSIQAVPGASSTADFYVATDGNDSWSGTLAAPNSNNTNGPFATIGRAQTAVQGILQNPHGRTKPIRVLVRAGTYYVSQALNFGTADSGTSTLQVNWVNYPDEVPVISGGMRITNWAKSGNEWTATLPTSTQYFEQLFYNGQRRLRPRLGGSLGTYYRVSATVYLPGSASGPAPDPNCTVYMAGLGWECFDRFVYTSTDPISDAWQNLNSPYPQGDIALYIFEKWDASKLLIKSIDTANNIIYLTGPTYQEDFYHGFTPGHRYMIENVKNDLNQPGQWFLNRSKTPWTLSYIPNSGENPPTDTVIIPQATQVLVATGLQYVTFEGITFEHDDWTVPSIGYPSTTGDQAIPAAVGCYNCSNVTFNGVTVTQTSGGGLELYTTSTSSTTAYNTIENSAFYDVGATGIRYGLLAQYSDTDANVAQFGTVENNVVSGVGRNIPSVEAIFQGDGHDNLYTHNDVYDSYHGGIHICALACPPGGQNSHGAYNNTVSFNHIYNLGQGILNDFGGVYFNTDAAATGNQVLNNKVHDASDASALDSDGYGGQGIYLDNNTSNTLVENNLVYRTSSALAAETCGPQTPGTADNIVNNIFAYGRSGAKQEGCAPPVKGVLQFNFTNNLVYFDRGKVQNGYVVCSGTGCPEVQMYANNMYCYITVTQCTPPANIFYTTNSSGQYGSGQTFASFTAWQSETGEDKGSVVQNPGFVSPAYPDDDYTLNESPGVGFVVFDPNLAGRTNPVIPGPTVEATFVTAPFNPATDF